jgi:hypothetical protein
MAAKNAPPGAPHEALVADGSAYSMAGPNTGLPADLRKPRHYPVEGLCAICHEVVRREKMAPEQLDWLHTGRKPGDPVT